MDGIIPDHNRVVNATFSALCGPVDIDTNKCLANEIRSIVKF